MRNRINYAFLGFCLPFLAALVVYGATPPTDTERSYWGGDNLLVNPGAEQGKYGWTASSASTFSTNDTSEVDEGKASFKFVSTTSGQTITSTAMPVGTPQGRQGAEWAVSCRFKTTNSDYQLQLVDDSNNVLTNTTSIAQIPVSTSYSRWTLTTSAPTSGNVYLRVRSQSAGTVRFDRCYSGRTEGFNAIQFSQAELFGAAYWAPTTNCSWTTGDTGNVQTDFTADTDCPNPTLYGEAQAPSTKVPRIEFATMKPGIYLIQTTGLITRETGATTAIFRAQMYDGVVTTGQLGWTSYAHTDPPSRNVMVGFLEVTSTRTSVSIRPRASSTNNLNDPFLSNDSVDNNAGFKIEVYRFPSTTDKAMRFDTVGQTWAGNEGTNCTHTTASNTRQDLPVDASCTFSTTTSVNTGTVTSTGAGDFTIPLNSPGLYFLCYNTVINNGSAADACASTLVQGSTLIAEDMGDSAVAGQQVPHGACGYYYATAGGSTTFKLQGRARTGAHNCVFNSNVTGGFTAQFSLTKVGQQVPAPIIPSTISTTNTNGERAERLSVGDTVCSTATCTIASQSGGFTSVTRGGVGSYTINITAATFSGRPSCDVSQFNGFGAGGVPIKCTVSSGATSVSVPFVCRDAAGTNTDVAFDVKCQGPR